MNVGGEDAAETEPHMLSIHRREGDRYYLADCAIGGGIWRVVGKRRLADLFFTQAGRASLLQAVGEPFHDVDFDRDQNGNVANVLFVPKVVHDPVFRGYDGLEDNKIRDAFPLSYQILNNDEAIPEGVTFVVSFVEATNPSITNL